METKGLIHMSAPDHPEAGRRNLPLERGPVAMRGVRDPTGVRDPAGVRTLREVRSPGCLCLSACLSWDTWRPRTFPGRGTGPVYCRKDRTSDRRGPAVWL